MLAIAIGVIAGHFSIRPSDELLGTSAQIIATLLVAYALEASWLIQRSRGRPRAEREGRLGAFSTIGIMSATGIVVALILAERARVAHWCWLDDFGFGWVSVSVFLLGLFIVLQPWITHEWAFEGDED